MISSGWYSRTASIVACRGRGRRPRRSRRSLGARMTRARGRRAPGRRRRRRRRRSPDRPGPVLRDAEHEADIALRPRSRTASSSARPPSVSLATTRTVFDATSVLVLLARLGRPPPPAPAAAAGLASAGDLKMPCTAPGTPYSYGPPTTVGTVSKLKIGGGEETCHSSVSARHGLAAARGPPRQLATML